MNRYLVLGLTVWVLLTVFTLFVGMGVGMNLHKCPECPEPADQPPALEQVNREPDPLVEPFVFVPKTDPVIYGKHLTDSGTVKRWKTAATSTDYILPSHGLVRIHVSEGRLVIYSSDLHEIVPHWSAANQVELEFIHNSTEE